MENNKFERNSYLLVLLFLAITGVCIVYANIQQERIRVCKEMQATIFRNTFGSLDEKIQAQSLFVFDFTKNIPLYAKQEQIVRPLASLTKLMTVRLALKKVSPLDFYTIQKHDLDSDGFVGFVIGDSYRISDLVSGALIASSNDSAVMLARSTGLSDDVFVSLMNEEAQSLHLTSLSFENPTGLDIDDKIATAKGSAQDILNLLYDNYHTFGSMMSKSTQKNEIIKAMSGRSIPLKNTNLAIDNLPLLLASKTGYTDTAGGNLAILWKDISGDELGASVLGSTESGRFQDMTLIHDAAKAYIAGSVIIPKYCKTYDTKN